MIDHAVSDSMKTTRGDLTSSDLRALELKLLKLSGYFEVGGDCQRAVSVCLEVVVGLRDLWVRDAGENDKKRIKEYNRIKFVGRSKRYKPVSSPR